MVNLETSGIPGVFVASEVFVEAAAAQAQALGLDPAVVFVPHPIQDRTDDEMRALAERAVDEVLSRIQAAGPP
jgi:alkanesulfonate monooxygenase SsuD/methylene tetrahydromethanopterin reductase-like flavin-dependent oxidoreductase (luciferase family)